MYSSINEYIHLIDQPSLEYKTKIYKYNLMS